MNNCGRSCLGRCLLSALCRRRSWVAAVKLVVLKRYQEEKVSHLIPSWWRSQAQPRNDRAVCLDAQDAHENVAGGYGVCPAIIGGFAERAFVSLTRLQTTANRRAAPNPQRSVLSHPRFPHKKPIHPNFLPYSPWLSTRREVVWSQVCEEATEQAVIGVSRSRSSNNTQGMRPIEVDLVDWPISLPSFFTRNRIPSKWLATTEAAVFPESCQHLDAMHSACCSVEPVSRKSSKWVYNFKLLNFVLFILKELWTVSSNLRFLGLSTTTRLLAQESYMALSGNARSF